ncbi:hypothetical protein NC651_027093 [Populus alba x Populus x berolinensis]|nr:hypothetical protein NC651_027093 [Populus alba x Populus x berolinensis]
MIMGVLIIITQINIKYSLTYLSIYQIGYVIIRIILEIHIMDN